MNADWRRRGEGSAALSEDERAELAWPRKENAELTMERDVLKSSALVLTGGLRLLRILCVVCLFS